MTCIHINPEFLDAVGRGDLPSDVFAMSVWKHLLEVCPSCAEAFRRWVDPSRSAALPASGVPHGEAPEGDKERSDAKRELAELRRIDRAARLPRIRNARRRFRSPALVDLLLDASRQSIHAAPEEALHYAELALAVADRTGGSEGEARIVLASARLGNAHRVLGRLGEADRFLSEARLALRRSEVMDSLVYAEVDSLEASLRTDQRDFAEARRLLDRSSLAYRLAGADLEVARNLLNLSYVHFHAGEVERAIEVLYEALEAKRGIQDRRLELWMRHNLALYLVEAGDAAGARQIFAESQELYRSFHDPRTRLRRTWLVGRIARAEESHRDAEEALQATAHGFEALGDGYESALAFLDLAELYYVSGRRKKLKALATALQTILEAEHLHQEAVAALLLVHGAIRDEIVTTTLLRRVRLYLDEAKNNPALKLDDI